MQVLVFYSSRHEIENEPSQRFLERFLQLGSNFPFPMLIGVVIVAPGRAQVAKLDDTITKVNHLHIIIAFPPPSQVINFHGNLNFENFEKNCLFISNPVSA